MIFRLQQIPTALKALFRVARAYFADEPIVAAPKIQAARFLSCQVCPRYLAQYDQCGACLCVVDLKVSLASESCPIGRWGRQTRFTKV